ncbi:MAG: AAA family ATPase [Chlamydiae bacterium]|nr:AAA family ATPase [Chlamydiota bacterium]
MQAWQQFLTALESDLGADTVQKWLRSLKVVHFDAGNLYLEAPDSFQIAWFEEHIREKARKKLVNNNFNPIKIHLSCNAPDEIEHSALSLQSDLKNHQSSRPQFKIHVDQIDEHAKLELFIANETSHMAYEVVCCLGGLKIHSKLSAELGLFNPIYIYGPSGTGKTHLLMGLTQALKNLQYNAYYVKMETFTENVVSAIRSGNMQEFRKAYRHVDVLLVDDVHILAKKTATQEEFFHTFNSLHTIGKQIVLTANCSPLFLQDIEPRLVSRFEWGIPLQVGPLNRSELSLMLEKRLQLLEFPLQKKVLEYLLDTFSCHHKSLHKAIEALVLRSHRSSSRIQSTHLSEIEVRDLLQDLIIDAKKQVLNPQKIVQAVAEFYGIKFEDILGKSQSHEFTLPRQIAMFLCRNKIKMPFTHIGQFFKRDHSTVISSVNIIKERNEQQDPELSSALRLLTKTLESVADDI